MLRRNEVELMMERAENLGIHLKFDCGLVLVEQTATADPEASVLMIEQLGKHRHEIHSILERRTISARAKHLLGRRVWFPEFQDGRLTEVNGDQLIALVSGRSISVLAKDILILPATTPSSPAAHTPRSPENMRKQ